MAPPDLKIDEEQKSYSAVFLLSVGLLLAGAVWAVWDDNISRRPWKRYQAEFFSLEVDRVRQEIAEEEKRLTSDPQYQDLTRQLAEARERLATGETARRLEQLQDQRVEVKTKLDEHDLDLRIVKSKLEEAWYEYEHAVLTNAPTEKAQAHIDELDEEKVQIEAALASTQSELDKIDNEVRELRSEVEDLENKIRGASAARERLEQKLDGLLIKLGPFAFPRVPKIEQVVLNEFDRNAYDQPVARVDRCQSCHIGAAKQGFEQDPQPYATHPSRDTILAHHPPERFGCTPCHAGQGAAVNSVKQAHGEVRFWEHPLLREEMVQSSCISCHIDVRLPGAEVIARGEKLFVQLGCHGCHLVEGYGELDKVGPYLRRIAAKAEPGWLARWIENPREFRSQTKMPDFFYDMRRDEKDEEARAQSIAIAAYLLDAAKEESEKWLAGHPPPRGIDPQDPVKVNAGKDLVDSIGCRGCHGFAEGESPALLGESKDIAPNLSGIAEKVDARWLYHWLKNPRHYSPVARMPSLRLSDEEAVSIASYLMTLGSPKPADADLLNALGKKEVVERGKTLVRKYGCFGCHDIPGMEAETRIGVELSTFGSKLLEELFFGNRTDVPVTWYHWTYHKLKDPRTYATERIEQIMPQFSLAEADVKALMVFLKSRSEEEVPEQYHPAHIEREKTLVRGRLVVEKYNCVGCHVIEGQGGAILARYEEAPTMGPPILNGQGAKVQPDWLFGFLKRPVSLRPWLRVRMPTFGLSDEEATVIVQYFLAQEKVTVPFTYVDVAAIPAEHVEAGRLLMSPDYLNCFSCHQQGERKPEGPEEGWAPDLALARERLNPDWVIRWLRDPQALQPGTKMPSFYNFEDETPDGPEDILGGSDERQVEALRDYIMTLSPMPSPVLAGAKGSDGRQAMPN